MSNLQEDDTGDYGNIERENIESAEERNQRDDDEQEGRNDVDISFNTICLECKTYRVRDNGTWVCDKCLEKHNKGKEEPVYAINGEGEKVKVDKEVNILEPQ